MVSDSGGYRLDVDPDRVDLHRFHRAVEETRQPGLSDGQWIVLMREATGLWRGEHPLVETLTAVLMRALHAAGRTTDALVTAVHPARRSSFLEWATVPSDGGVGLPREEHLVVVRVASSTGAARRLIVIDEQVRFRDCRAGRGCCRFLMGDPTGHGGQDQGR